MKTDVCKVCGRQIGLKTITLVEDGKTVRLCDKACLNRWNKERGKDGIANGLRGMRGGL